MVELAGKTLGIIGYGRIGQAVAIRAAAFGMEVLVCSSHTIREEAQIHAASIAEVYRRADILSLHCPLTEERRGMIDRRADAEMKDGVLLIDAARGPLIREEDLYEALCSGKVGGAALDVLSQEPPRNGDLPTTGAPQLHHHAPSGLGPQRDPEQLWRSPPGTGRLSKPERRSTR